MKTRIFILFILPVLLFSCNGKQSTVIPYQLTVEYKQNPFIDTSLPRLSWKLSSEQRNQFQTAYQILVSSDPAKLNENEADLWNSGKVLSGSSNQIEYNGKPLTSRTKYWWKIRSWDKDGIAGPWSNIANWEMGLLSENDWQAKWIGYDLTEFGKGDVYHLPPVPYLRKELALNNEIVNARLYVTALGLYNFEINGKKVGNEWLSPGWTDYHKRLYYQVYDVTNYLKPGANALGVTLSYGWYAGYTGYALLVKLPKVKAFYGEVPKLLAQLEIEYKNGEKAVFTTDGTWKATESPIIESDLLNGEMYDARKELKGWNMPEYNDDSWQMAEEYTPEHGVLQIHPAPPVVVTDVLKPKKIISRPDGKYIVDLGQNFAGIVTLRVKGVEGQKIVLRFGEMLHNDGRLMTENLRKARAIDTYICKGDPEGEEWTPQFTFHGFQYVEISGLDYEPDSNVITGLAFSTDNPVSGTFETSDEMVNQLYSNIVWTQKSNFIDIPTDCPQRDERLGWTGDAQVYISSAIMNNDVAAFFNKWITDLNDAQWDFGAYPNFAPKPYIRTGLVYSPGWMEAGIICPYHIFKAYGDKRVVQKYWDNMERFMDFHFEKSQGKYVYHEGSFEDIRPKGGFADWLSIGKKTPPDLLASFYYGYSAKLMSEMAKGIGKNERAEYYEDLFEKIKAAVKLHYMDEEGRFKCDASVYGNGEGYVDGDKGFSGHTQTAYANAIYMDFLSEAEKAKAGKYLAELVESNGTSLTTGFLGVKQLLPALSETGSPELAYQLLLNKDYPSWGFEIEQGATTIWERWNSYTIEGGFVAGMNSFSHYAFGSVFEWMIQHMAGIKNSGIAFNKIAFKPETDPRFSFVKATYNSVYGFVESSWEITDDVLKITIEVPVNSEAEVFLPAREVGSVYEGGKPLSGAIKGVKDITEQDEMVVVHIGSGRYLFEIKN